MEPDTTNTTTKTDGPDWVALNKSFRKNSGEWSRSAPGPRLILFKNVMMATSRMVNRALFLSGSSFDRLQDLNAAEGKERQYRIVEAAKMTDVRNFFTIIGEQFQSQAKGLPTVAMTTAMGKLHFVMLSRAGCAMHQLVRHPRGQHPFQLFRMLVLHQAPSSYDELQKKPCLYDELATAFFKHFPSWTKEAECVLRGIAHGIILDVAQIETRHAISRRMTTLKSLQTWASKLECVSAEWAHRQSNMREAEVYGKADEQTMIDAARRVVLGPVPCSQKHIFVLQMQILLSNFCLSPAYCTAQSLESPKNNFYFNCTLNRN